MTKQEYIKQVVKYLRCSPKKKSEIEKQLISDIEIALDEGRKLEDVLADMGEPEALAGEFNENLGEEGKHGKKKSKRRILLIILVILILMAGIIYWVLPKSKDISKSKIFDEAKVRACSEEIIMLYSAGEYEEFYGYMSDELIDLMNGVGIEEINSMIGEDWGSFRGIGKMYIGTVSQMWREYAMAQVNVSYENVVVTFTFIFNSDMQLDGFYVK